MVYTPSAHRKISLGDTVAAYALRQRPSPSLSRNPPFPCPLPCTTLPVRDPLRQLLLPGGHRHVRQEQDVVERRGEEEALLPVARRYLCTRSC